VSDRRRISERRESGLTGILEDHLLAGALENIFLDCILRDESVDVDVRFLTDTMGSSHSLKIVLRVPIEAESG